MPVINAAVNAVSAWMIAVILALNVLTLVAVSAASVLILAALPS